MRSSNSLDTFRQPEYRNLAVLRPHSFATKINAANKFCLLCFLLFTQADWGQSRSESVKCAYHSDSGPQISDFSQIRMEWKCWRWRSRVDDVDADGSLLAWLGGCCWSHTSPRWDVTSAFSVKDHSTKLSVLFGPISPCLRFCEMARFVFWFTFSRPKKSTGRKR